MSELRALALAARHMRDERRAFVSATVVDVRGSGYRKAGARMLVSHDAWLAGSISGGCLERDVLAKGFWYTRDERVRLVTYDDAQDALDERTGTGCQGVVDVLLERHEPAHADPADVFVACEHCIREESVAAALTVVASSRADLPLGARLVLQAKRWQFAREHAALRELFGQLAERAVARASGTHRAASRPYLVERRDATGALRVLVEPIVPPVHLHVFGTGHDAVPLVALAKQLGWSVSVWDASPRSSARERFRLADHYLTGRLADAIAGLSRCVRGAAVVMGHDLTQDRAAVQALLRSDVRYLGILGSRRRSEAILEDCRASGIALDAETLRRVHTPVGLSLGAQTPAEIALAILAQVQAELACPAGPALRSASDGGQDTTNM